MHEAVRLATCSPLRCVIWSHPCAQDCEFPLEGPQANISRSEYSWARRNRVLGPASNGHIPVLGHQRCVLLGVSTMTLVLLDFLSSWSCSVYPLLEQIFAVGLRPFEFDGHLVLSWTIPPLASLI